MVLNRYPRKATLICKPTVPDDEHNATFLFQGIQTCPHYRQWIVVNIVVGGVSIAGMLMLFMLFSRIIVILDEGLEVVRNGQSCLNCFLAIHNLSHSS